MVVNVRVSAGARREKVVLREQVLHISVREEARGNAANDRVRSIIARMHGVPLSAVRLIRGYHSSHKVFSIASGE